MDTLAFHHCREMAAVHENVRYHAVLLETIAALDYVPSALDEQRRMIKNLQAQEMETFEKLRELEKTTVKERKEHEELRDSTARRLAAKIAGHKDEFEAKASKEERYASYTRY